MNKSEGLYFTIGRTRVPRKPFEEMLDSVLTSIEKGVLILRFGMEDGKELTLREIAEFFKLTPERIRQIEARALRKLKHQTSKTKLREFNNLIPEAIEDKDHEKIAQLPVDLSINLISTNIYDELIRYFLQNPEEMKKFDRRKLEEIIAHLFNGFGYEVELTKMTRDGGRDIIAIKEKGAEVAVKYLIEVKRPEPETPIRIGPVRELYAVKIDEQATKAVLATTTHFTRDAKFFFDKHKWELEPRDFYGIMSWIEDYLKMRK